MERELSTEEEYYLLCWWLMKPDPDIRGFNLEYNELLEFVSLFN